MSTTSSSNQRRVVHLTTVHHPYDPRIFHKQLKSLALAGFESHLVAPNDSVEREGGVTIHPLPEVEGRWKRQLLQLAAWEVATTLDADLYEIHDPELIPLAFLLRRKMGTPIVYDMHEDYRSRGALLGRGLRSLEQWCFGWIDHVLLAEKSYRSIVSGHHVPHSVIENYYKPISRDGLASEPETTLPEGTPTCLLYTGTVSNSRGLSTMLAVARELRRRDEDASVRMVGICRYPAERVSAERWIKREDLGSVVKRVGWETYVPAEDMQRHYHSGDVGLALCEPHPNLTGSLLTKFYEYLYFGLPIICSDFPLWRDFIEENECGAVIPPGDAQAVVDVLEEWQEHPNRYQTLARNARTAASKYRWEKMARRLVDVYRELLPTRENEGG